VKKLTLALLIVLVVSTHPHHHRNLKRRYDCNCGSLCRPNAVCGATYCVTRDHTTMNMQANYYPRCRFMYHM
jgi:hypothetical protein